MLGVVLPLVLQQVDAVGVRASFEGRDGDVVDFYSNTAIKLHMAEGIVHNRDVSDCDIAAGVESQSLKSKI
ncbi:hypothetical protein Nepgr_022572 [Nepenthes gracilis]|uniref:Uncharacterized protein n=1 Tax=Nepenthes gracilis TaxID=150966 RepID=A0AAD3XYB2_NEPGR|nr:hypothetical protein Nepgr_022572 [Nepenthes gracilis]